MTDFWRCVLTLTAGGLLGGLLFWTSGLLATEAPKTVAVGDEPPEDEKAKGGAVEVAKDLKAGKPGRFTQSVLNAFTGTGGAWAVALAQLWAKRFPKDRLLLDELELLATAIISGYAANKILPMVADRLTKEFVEQKATEVKQSANDAAEQREEAQKAATRTATVAQDANSSRIVSEAIEYLNPMGNQSEHQTADFIERLRKVLEREPTFRQAAILLGRMYAECVKDNAQAVAAMRSFIEAKKTAGEEDKNVSDAYWNVANYLEIEYQKSGKAELRTQAIDSLAASIRIVPGYKVDYATDEDFADLRKDPDARQRLPLVET